MPETKKIITIAYKFKLSDGREKSVVVSIDKSTMDAVVEQKPAYAPWVKLEYNKCPNCTFKGTENALCPAAVAVYDTVENFRNEISSEEVTLTIETPERAYAKTTALQNAVSSLMGLQMATSKCPIMSKLKPMARFHLPFASMEETKYRMLSMHFLAQFFKQRKGLPVDWSFKKLCDVYTEINTANNSFSKRLYDKTSKDANINALIKLDVFASTISFLMDEETLNEMEQWFGAYMG